jgi:hypothetical protein
VFLEKNYQNGVKMVNLIRNLDFFETINTILSYITIGCVLVVIVVFGMRLERHIIGSRCVNQGEIIIEGELYRCYKAE